MHYKASYIPAYEALKAKCESRGLGLTIEPNDEPSATWGEDDRHDFVLRRGDREIIRSSYVSDIETALRVLVASDES